MRKHARIVIAVFGVAFAVFFALQFRQRATAPSSSAIARKDPGAIAETTAGTTLRVSGSREDVSVAYERLFAYPDGSNKFEGVTITVPDRNKPDRITTIKAREARKGADESDLNLDGDVRLESSDGTAVRTEHATYTQSDGTMHAPGPVGFSKGRMSGTGVGVRFDKTRDYFNIVSQAVVNVAPDDKGAGAATVRSGSLGFARRDHYLQFDGGVHIERAGQTIDAEAALARLTEDEKQIQTLELHNHANITATAGGPGSLRRLGGADMTLTYAKDGESLERAIIFNEATIQMAGEAGKPGRQITAKTLDIGLGPDGSTPTLLTGRENVELALPADGDTPARTINAASLVAKGEPGEGLTRATFTGAVQYRERGGSERAASSAQLDVVMKPGTGAIDEARFAHDVRFEEGAMAALAAAARYDIVKGLLELSGSEPR